MASSVLPDPRPDDQLIAVVGVTGSGKSSFINKYFGKDYAEVGHGHEPKTRQIVPCYDRANASSSNRVILLDTPGFDSGLEKLADEDILSLLSGWIKKTYPRGNMKLAGIIYLHDITVRKQTSGYHMYLRKFTQLCGANDCRRVALCTSQWDSDDVESDSHEEVLARERGWKEGLWREAIEQGAQVCQILDGKEDSKRVVEEILRRYRQEVQAPQATRRPSAGRRPKGPPPSGTKAITIDVQSWFWDSSFDKRIPLSPVSIGSTLLFDIPLSGDVLLAPRSPLVRRNSRYRRFLEALAQLYRSVNRRRIA
ncbi:hypothetical protein CC1G_12075 [Coprinopsis cinerea okayama7|uniref:G domain-containing protein n=1 Tax=Coprinopsis cinerea (strain Okayama-7 / 130 / ATCC MYA-4618 / FGSC 9003) TaxID=240176 RepID=A8N0E4_COPC7|nr:hypothetical protein CC1G_12075 [Coprinopsis cinerea okayama7\|eukprot:XP_001828345.2 hypothetical protein CC1G_12075 [Coprinopsis cinerea okayama7\